MGPAINCGNREIYSPTYSGFFCTFPSPLYTSSTYDIAWNVKKEMPIGSVIVGTVMLVPNRELMLLSVNIRYLNTNSNPRFPATSSATSAFAAFLPLRLSNSRPISQLNKMEAIMIKTNFGSPHA